MADVWREIRNGVDVVTGPRGLIIIDTKLAAFLLMQLNYPPTININLWLPNESGRNVRY